MNLPPPPPITANELLDNTTRLLMEEEGIGEHQARYKAARAIARLIAIGAYEWWGMTNEGEPLFVQAPLPPTPVIIVAVPWAEEE